MEVVGELNAALNLGTAGLVAYTAAQLRSLRRQLAEEAQRVREDLAASRRPTGGP